MIRTGTARFIPNLIIRLPKAEEANQLTLDAECYELSLGVFEQNEGALRLHERHGSQIVARRLVLPGRPGRRQPHNGRMESLAWGCVGLHSKGYGASVVYAKVKGVPRGGEREQKDLLRSR